MNYAHVAKMAVAVLFADVVTAFMAMCRFLALEIIPGSKEQFIRKLTAMNFAALTAPPNSAIGR